jgi:WhiB family redox-sensing transcriptional regulator
MSRALVLGPEAVRRVRRDPRFQAAAHDRVPSADWRSRGECLKHDPELFFPNAAEDPAPAVAICRVCPVQAACLAAALDAGECDGVWGGTTQGERRAMRRVWALAH